MQRAADVLIEVLKAHEIDRVFCVPGESYLNVLDALADYVGIDVVTCRHEGGAGFMAIADARLTGRAGVAMVSRGPGAMNAAIAVHTAQQDAVPLVLFVGQVERAHRHMAAFQEVDYGQVFGSMAKWVIEVNDADQLADRVASAFHYACSGTPGPVIVALPEDMLEDMVEGERGYRLPLPAAAASDSSLKQVASMIAKARRPLIIAGGLLKNEEGQRALQSAAEAFGIPVATAVRHADLLANDHPLFAGHLAYGAPAALAQAVGQADLVIAVGTRLGDVTTQGYVFPAAPHPAQPLVHVWPDASALGALRKTDAGLVADPDTFLMDLRKFAPASRDPDHEAWSRKLHQVAQSLADWHGPGDAEDGVVFSSVVQAANRLLADDAIITIDAGNFGGWVQRLLRFGGGRKMVAPSSGAMGYGVPAAVAASLRYPERQVVCFVGDGGFMMTGNELATAIQYGVNPILVISDNSAYGTIRMHQEKHFPERVSATGLRNPDFAALARDFGALGISVNDSSQVDEALRTALAARQPTVVSVRTSLQYISASATIEKLRERANSTR
ncbi:acetolactate synthase [Advenella sp. S44]|uniref:thiamine pyrophosphate-dependent enzyme n=1 Tax=Advenella sp. S44 TaxID=1982755 RepID=UPI000C29CE62|nr:thiamine pyrophosphate-dependent enzyme [Advenella sp. S44]PJX20975.1 acetolactate synthase [Advenella sp. S44]